MKLSAFFVPGYRGRETERKNCLRIFQVVYKLRFCNLENLVWRIPINPNGLGQFYPSSPPHPPRKKKCFFTK